MYTDSNNAAEYEALLHGLRIAVSIGVRRLEVRGDSNLAISQVNGEFDAKDPKMTAYRNAVLKISARFEGLEFHHIPRDSNQAADILARMGAKWDEVPKNTFLERLFKPSMVWQADNITSESNDTGRVTPPRTVEDEDIIGGSAIQETASAHEVMAVIAPWTKPLLAYLLRKELPEDPLPQATANATHESETPRPNCVRCMNRKRCRNKIVANKMNYV
jgi:hypothetical protein